MTDPSDRNLAGFPLVCIAQEKSLSFPIFDILKCGDLSPFASHDDHQRRVPSGGGIPTSEVPTCTGAYSRCFPPPLSAPGMVYQHSAMSDIAFRVATPKRRFNLQRCLAPLAVAVSALACATSLLRHPD